MKQYRYRSVLSIAGFDGSGGAGIQADIKTISALGCYATTVLTALPVQNTQGVQFIHSIPEDVVEKQLKSIFDDIVPDAIKIGMVHSIPLVHTIASVLSGYPSIPVVFDPVMISTSGHKLIEDDTIAAIVEKLFPIATIITPNMDEAAVLVKAPVQTIEDIYTAGEKIKRLGCSHVLVKGGHMQSKQLTSVLFSPDGMTIPFTSARIVTRNMHGSGCTLSSAIASYLALGQPVATAAAAAQDYVFQAILEGSDVVIGKGNGPLNHFSNPHKLIKHEME